MANRAAEPGDQGEGGILCPECRARAVRFDTNRDGLAVSWCERCGWTQPVPRRLVGRRAPVPAPGRPIVRKRG